MTEPKYIVGIDLGTTHCVLAYMRTDGEPDAEPDIQLFPIPQVISEGEVKGQLLLPSFLFLPGEHDVAEASLALPWDADIDFAVGEFARSRGAELPARLVASAKSWLCHVGIDRTQPILPWEAPADARKVSPVDAVARYLAHIRAAWNQEMTEDEPDARLEDQSIFLTVPASFDAVARELTVQAAQQAGLENFTLLEEPQAAFYSWIAAHNGEWRDLIEVGESILVCDVGGGTTDFSLIQVIEEDGNLELERTAVGDHILLGGDNMDLTLAYAIRAKLSQEDTQLDNWQFRGLWHSCRRAKERLLGDPELDSEPVVILGRGSSLIDSTIRTELTREEIDTTLLQGFFPEVAPTDYPARNPQVGVREMGLPYAPDPAITKHMAQFLGEQTSRDDDEPPTYPAAVLFNGGVMKAESLCAQVVATLHEWSSSENFRKLESVNLDTAVAQGAVYYGLARQGQGIRIRAGAARSYYIGIESSLPAVPGIPTPIKALCVVPFGMEEGTESDVVSKEFGLIVGEPAIFPLLASSTRKADEIGQEVEDWRSAIQEVAKLETMLPATDTDEGGTILPVMLQSRYTEVGTLELWCVARDDDRQWKLEFNIREQDDA